MSSHWTTRPRRLAAEAAGTGMLVTAVVGSGIAASRLSPADVGLQLLENALSTGFALAVLILVFRPVSGAHFNPLVSLADWWFGRRDNTGLAGRDVPLYVGAQVVGAVAGAALADVMYGLTPLSLSSTPRTGAGLWLGELVATAGLILVIFALARSGQLRVLGAAVGAYIAAAYWFTSSTSFANPAVTIGRAFTDTFAGIAPASVPAFVLAQVAGAVIGAAAVVAWFPTRHHVGRDDMVDNAAGRVPGGRVGQEANRA